MYMAECDSACTLEWVWLHVPIKWKLICKLCFLYFSSRVCTCYYVWLIRLSLHKIQMSNSCLSLELVYFQFGQNIWQVDKLKLIYWFSTNTYPSYSTLMYVLYKKGKLNVMEKKQKSLFSTLTF